MLDLLSPRRIFLLSIILLGANLNAARAELTAYWPFDEGTGTMAEDATGNGYNGTLTNVGWDAGKFGNAVTFDGAGDDSRVTIADPDDDLSPGNLTGGGGWSLSIWAKGPLPPGGDNWVIFRKHVDEYNFCFLRVGPTGLLRFIYEINDSRRYDGYSSSLATFVPNQWNHLVVSIDGATSQLRMYVNGVDATSSSYIDVSIPLVLPGSQMSFGNTPENMTGTNYGEMTGALDDARIYHHALSAAEVQALYGTGGGVMYLRPYDGEWVTDVDPALMWTPGEEALAEQVYFGTDPGSLTLVANQPPLGTYVMPGFLDIGQTYYWRVDQVYESETVTGEVQAFTVYDAMLKDDLSLPKLAQRWLDSCASCTWCDGADMNADSKVDFVDFSAYAQNQEAQAASKTWLEAQRRGEIYRECLRNADMILQDWMTYKRDPVTSLYSKGGTWEYANEGADHYASLVLMANFVDHEELEPGGSLYTTLVNSINLCASPTGIPTTYSLTTYTQGSVSSAGAIAEWLRDGLIRITEVMGDGNIWYEEQIRLSDAIIARAASLGGMMTMFTGLENRGTIMQAFARLTAMSGDTRYLEAAEEIADYYLADPLVRIGTEPFRDHGCEIVPGLGDVFIVECKLGRPRAVTYHDPMQVLLDRILEIGREPNSGLLYYSANLVTGTVDKRMIVDDWGYVLFALDAYDRATGENRYTEALLKPLCWLTDKRPIWLETIWFIHNTIDDWSDSYESTVNIWHQFPIIRGYDRLNWHTYQGGHRNYTPGDLYGPGNGGHYDGSTGRCLSNHAMLSSQGVRALPFRRDLRCGAVPRGKELYVSVKADSAWSGALYFDGPRFANPLTLNMDWARINQLPAWFVVEPTASYQVSIDGAAPVTCTGLQLQQGIPVNVLTDEWINLHIRPAF